MYHFEQREKLFKYYEIFGRLLGQIQTGLTPVSDTTTSMSVASRNDSFTSGLLNLNE